MNDELTRALGRANTPEAIEAVFQQGLKLPRREQRGIATACNERALKIAKRYVRGHLLAIRLDKGSGCSERYSVDGEVFKTARWGNGTGCRYALHEFKQWYHAKLLAGGMANEYKRGTVIDWCMGGYLWRALQVLAGR